MSRIIGDIGDMVFSKHPRNAFSTTLPNISQRAMQKSSSGKIVIAGGSGFLGGVLARHLNGQGYGIVVLSRNPTAVIAGARTVEWDGTSIGEWVGELEGCRAVINLAGRSVNCRYHAKNRKLLMDSRVESTRVIGQAIANLKQAPEVWLNASTATIYKHSLDHEMDEITGVVGATPEAKDAFSVQIAQAWERTFDEHKLDHTRKVTLRSAMVLSAGTAENNVYRVLRRLVRFGLGGKMASGKQYVSWVHEIDFCRAIVWLIEHKETNGVVNIAAPAPITNADMMRSIRELHGMRIGLPAAKWMLEIGAFFLRTETELIIKSRRVVPRRLIEAGFDFNFKTFESAIRDFEGLKS